MRTMIAMMSHDNYDDYDNYDSHDNNSNNSNNYLITNYMIFFVLKEKILMMMIL